MSTFLASLESEELAVFHRRPGSEQESARKEAETGHRRETTMNRAGQHMPCLGPGALALDKLLWPRHLYPWRSRMQ
jgi:hypothetical protein